MKVLGIMSGTSIDGVDYALCEVTERSIRLIRHWSRAFPVTMRRRLHAAASNESAGHELAQLHHDLGRLYARQARQLRVTAKLVGLHGQTVFHNPERSAPATMQIGEPAYLAEALRIPVINNFRSADIAAGGQGAPLASLFHKVSFAKPGQHVCVNNLGGISNVTSLDWREGKEPRIAAFDTGPGNVLMDIAMRHFTRLRSCDRNGAWARRGKVHETLVSRWLSHSYFKQPPPKSTGRELFGEKFWKKEQGRIARAALSPFDVLATLTEFTARSLALSYQLHLRSTPACIVLCGGGAKNPVLVRSIAAAFPLNMRVITSETLGWPSQSIESAAFALLAFSRWKGCGGNIPLTTGARRSVLLGQITEI